MNRGYFMDRDTQTELDMGAEYDALFEWAGKPSIGRIVHYHSHGSADGRYLPEPRAAVVTGHGCMQTSDNNQTWYLAVPLAVLNPTGLFFNQAVPYSPTPQPGHWSWPPRI